VASTATTQANNGGNTIQAGNWFLWQWTAIGGSTSRRRGKFLENMKEIAHIRLPKRFLMLHCSA
jgi:hypothetical protein